MAAFLAVLCFPFALAFVAWSFYSTWRRRRPWLILMALNVVHCEGCLILTAHGQAHRWDGIELNHAVTVDQMVGTWRHEQEWVTLSADGTFFANDGLRGTWRADGIFQADVIPPDGRKVPLAVIRKDGRTVLLKPPGAAFDADEWDLRKIFVKQGP